MSKRKTPAPVADNVVSKRKTPAPVADNVVSKRKTPAPVADNGGGPAPVEDPDLAAFAAEHGLVVFEGRAFHPSATPEEALRNGNDRLATCIQRWRDAGRPGLAA